MRLLLLSLFVCLLVIGAEAQTKDPVIGQPFENYIFNDVHYYAKKSVSTDEFKGKWLILDFWDEYCAGCVASFPGTNDLQKNFKDQVKFLLVGYNGTEVHQDRKPSGIKTLFETLRKSGNLDLSIAYDSILYDKYEIGGVGCPYIIIIDPDGNVKYLTGHLKKEALSRLIAHQDFDLLPIQRLFGTGFSFKPHTRVLDSAILFENSISKWTPGSEGFQIRPYLPADTSTTDSFEILGMGLDYLYRFALTGYTDWDNPGSKYYSTFKFYPILGIKDSSDFDSDKKFSFEFKTNKKVTRREIMQILRQDLRSCFGYKAKIDTSLCPYWSLTLKDSITKSVLATKGGPTELKFLNNSEFLGFNVVNVPFSIIITMLFANFQLHKSGYGNGVPFIDNTGIDKNIDISIQAVLSNFDEFKAALEKKGILLKLERAPMPSIVVSEK
jgi:thiol-disulfide isomerase/thioredoxin